MNANAEQPPDVPIEAASKGESSRVDKILLPFSKSLSFCVGALVGVILRVAFSSQPGQSYAAMNWQFILLVPLAVGAVTVYVAEKKTRRSWGYYVWASAFANLLFVLGTMLILIEGLICAIVIVPLFCLVGIFGGLMMGAVCRTTKWPKQAVYSFALLPLILGALPPSESDRQQVAVIDRAIVIQATPDKIWHQLHNVTDIKSEEVGQAWMYRIGVPLPLAGVTQLTPTGLVRKITMGKSIYFDQVSDDWEENRYGKWRYRFFEDSFPPKALDDHVMIGGHYFDLVETEYQLVPQDAHSTELKIRMHYRVSTEFNWYAKPVAKLLIGNFEDVILGFYDRRSTGGATRSL
ncbi:hypothetical protein BH11PSE11_BH11PSE11_07850 [soil metagenome]